ncbi:hypothetical protein SDC9_50642 [bioreactor metagenome]|uniref:Uncharacterized protein n=1 Tax=bioreactor metagenome TaxID=1076179 RepID=A0A644WKF5_9ZZZZ
MQYCNNHPNSIINEHKQRLINDDIIENFVSLTLETGNFYHSQSLEKFFSIQLHFVMTSPQKMKRLFKINLLFSIFFFFIVIVLMMNGNLTYGGCLADLIPFYLQTIWLFILLLIYFFVSKRKTISKLFMIVFSIVVIFSVIYSLRGFTIGRGNCYRWNGHVFVNYQNH